MGGTFTFPSKIFNGKRYELDGVYLSAYASGRKEASERVATLRRQGWFARVAPANRDTKGGRRVGYLGVYKRARR